MTDDKDRTDAVTVTWTTAKGRKRRILFEPRSDRKTGRVEQEYRDGEWQYCGGETVRHVEIEAPENSDFLRLFPDSQVVSDD